MSEPRGAHRGRGALAGVTACAVVSVAAVAALTVVAAWGLDPRRDLPALGAMAALGLVAAGGAAIAAWLAAWHRRDLERLRGALLSARGVPDAFSRQVARLVEDDALRRLADTLEAVLVHRDDERRRAERRLAAVVAASPSALLVITDSGLVSLVNAAARTLFPAEAIRPGTSIYAALARDGLVAAGARARSAGRPVRAMLATNDGVEVAAGVAAMEAHGGLVLAFDAPLDEHEGADVAHDLALHDLPPSAGPPGPETGLSELPIVALDSETTGLDVRSDRLVSLGAVRGHGGRLYPAMHLDTLVDPGVRIPAASTAIHGIGDDMVRGAAGAAEALARFEALGRGCVAVGHNIGFDLAVLRAEARRAGLDWTPPPALDTAHLVSALDPDLAVLDLERIAARFGVATEGRHTALGDALVAGEIFVLLLPRLADRGVTTLGEAWRFARRARGLVAQQRAAGWILPGDGHDG